MTKLNEFTEFETKYSVEQEKILLFKSIMSQLGSYRFHYVEGPDYYYTNDEGSFIRFRNAHTEKRAEVTFKHKPIGAKTNIVRKEINWRVDGNNPDLIKAGIEMLGYNFNFSIWKSCHIYKFKDATVVFYTVKDLDNKFFHFVEIELDEATISKLTHDQAMGVIRKYEKVLEPIGITHRNRLSKSLFEMFVRENKNERLDDRSSN